MRNEILSDIEKDIDGDWKDIYDEVEKKHKFEEIQDVVIPNFPSYEEFYECLIHCLYNDDRMSTLPVDFLHMAHRITQSRDMEKPSKSFNELWSFFCDPRRYNTVKRDCPCGVSYTVILKRSHLQPHRSYSDRSDRIFGGAEWERVEINQKYAYCVECGRSFLSLNNEELVGMFKE